MPNYTHPSDLLEEAKKLAEHWRTAPSEKVNRADRAGAEQLAKLMQDPQGVRFTMDFVDRVARPEDNEVAATELRKLPTPFSFLGPVNWTLLRTGALVSNVLPSLVMTLARARLRQMVGHLVITVDEGSDKALTHALAQAREDGVQLNLNLLGEAVLGHEEAKDRAQRVADTIVRPDVDYVSVKATSLCAQLNHWDEEGSLERLKDQLRPLYRLARDNNTFINLDMEEYVDFDLTIRLFIELIDEEEFQNYSAGIVLQAYLPDSRLQGLEKIKEFALERAAKGGAPIKVRLVKGANLSMERVQSEIHGWELPVFETKMETDGNYLRMLDTLLDEKLADSLRVGVASHNLYTLAVAYLMMKERGVERQVDAEMLKGMSPDQMFKIKEAFGSMILYTPVVRSDDFDVAVSYLVRRLEENSSPDNYLYAQYDSKARARQRDQLEYVGKLSYQGPDCSHRFKPDKNWVRSWHDPDYDEGFINEPDSDPANAADRKLAKACLKQAPQVQELEEVTDPSAIQEHLETARKHSAALQALSPEDRGKVLETIADELGEARGELISMMAFEAGKTIEQSDPEVSEAIDFASYYGHCARTLDERFTPHEVIAVIPPWNFPVAIPTGGITSSLAAGSAVIIKPAPQVVGCAQILVGAIRRGLEKHDLDPDTVQLVRADEGEAGKALVTGADSVILTGASETAKLFRSWNPRLNINAETSGKNAIIVTPAADPDLAAADVMSSAFGHSGQKCSAASLVILVGSAGESPRLRRQLLDAINSLKVGYGKDISTMMNGLIEPPGDKLRRGLTQLEDGETWLIKPRQLDETGTLWSPGVRDNVKPGSWFHTHECFGPVLGIMYAKTLDEAIAWQNATGFGLTGGIHSLDEEEITHWLERVEVGNAYVNRGITGAIVRRQPFGGWKNSSIGAGAKAGGPNYVAQLGTWQDGGLKERKVDLDPAVRSQLAQFRLFLDDDDAAWLHRAAELDELTWNAEFGCEHDPSGLKCEKNIFRYRKVKEPLLIRLGEDFAERDVYRLILGATRTGSPFRITSPTRIELGASVEVISDEEFAKLVTAQESPRVRGLGKLPDSVYEAVAVAGGHVYDQPVLADGRRELLCLLLEQSLSITTHRFGVIHEDPRHVVGRRRG